jgi:hypothetical protein
VGLPGSASSLGALWAIQTFFPSISEVAFSSGLEDRRRRRTIIQTATNMRPRPARPPTTPPAIAPVLELLWDPDVLCASGMLVGLADDDVDRAVDVLEATELELEISKDLGY